MKKIWRTPFPSKVSVVFPNVLKGVVQFSPWAKFWYKEAIARGGIWVDGELCQPVLSRVADPFRRMREATFVFIRLSPPTIPQQPCLH